MRALEAFNSKLVREKVGETALFAPGSVYFTFPRGNAKTPILSAAPYPFEIHHGTSVGHRNDLNGGT